MTKLKSQIKFAVSEASGKLIGFVSQHPKTKKLKGVRENSPFGKKICVLSEDLREKINPNMLYNVELKPMHNGKGFVVTSAEPVTFKGTIEVFISHKKDYRINISFGNKIIIFDPLNGKFPSSKTIDGVVKIIQQRSDLENNEEIIVEFKTKADLLIKMMKEDGVK